MPFPSLLDSVDISTAVYLLIQIPFKNTFTILRMCTRKNLPTDVTDSFVSLGSLDCYKSSLSWDDNLIQCFFMENEYDRVFIQVLKLWPMFPTQRNRYTKDLVCGKFCPNPYCLCMYVLQGQLFLESNHFPRSSMQIEDTFLWLCSLQRPVNCELNIAHLHLKSLNLN